MLLLLLLLYGCSNPFKSEPKEQILDIGSIMIENKLVPVTNIEGYAAELLVSHLSNANITRSGPNLVIEIRNFSLILSKKNIHCEVVVSFYQEHASIECVNDLSAHVPISDNLSLSIDKCIRSLSAQIIRAISIDYGLSDGKESVNAVSERSNSLPIRTQPLQPVTSCAVSNVGSNSSINLIQPTEPTKVQPTEPTKIQNMPQTIQKAIPESSPKIIGPNPSQEYARKESVALPSVPDIQAGILKAEESLVQVEDKTAQSIDKAQEIAKGVKKIQEQGGQVVSNFQNLLGESSTSAVKPTALTADLMPTSTVKSVQQSQASATRASDLIEKAPANVPSSAADIGPSPAGDAERYKLLLKGG